jgi:hypothetical protein
MIDSKHEAMVKAAIERLEVELAYLHESAAFWKDWPPMFLDIAPLQGIDLAARRRGKIQMEIENIELALNVVKAAKRT